jgi:choline dehydrogenase-like flavoprotein
MRLDRDSQRVARLEVTCLTGRRFSVRPKAVVLAAGGYANPTFTLVMLALRLADKLRQQLRRGEATSTDSKVLVATT